MSKCGLRLRFLEYTWYFLKINITNVMLQQFRQESPHGGIDPAPCSVAWLHLATAAAMLLYAARASGGLFLFYVSYILKNLKELL